MKKLFALLLVIAVALGIYVFATSKTNKKQNTKQEIAKVQTDEQSMQGRGGLKNLLLLGQDLTCTFERTDDNGGFTGTAYIANDTIRGDFAMHLEDIGNITSHLLKIDGVTYVWMGNTGSKFSETAATPVDPAKPDTNSVNLDDEVNYNCKPWRKDTKMFDIPTDVNFTDISAIMDNLTNTSPDTSTTPTPTAPQMDCSVCNQVPAGENRDQCKVALGC